MDLTVDLTLVCTITDKIDVFEAAWITTSDRTTRVPERNKSCGPHHVLIPPVTLSSPCVFFLPQPSSVVIPNLSRPHIFPSERLPRFPAGGHVLVLHSTFSCSRAPPGSSNDAVQPQLAVARVGEIKIDGGATRRRCGGVRHRFYGGAAAARGRRLCKRSTLLQ
jgi:hypothetical protein